MLRSTRILYLLVMLGFLIAACSNEPVTDDAATEQAAVPDEVFEDFVTQETDSGLVKWRLTAPKANRYTQSKTVMLENPIIKFFDDMGQLRTTLVSEFGEYSEETQDMLAMGNVIVETVDGDVLETDSLLWVNRKDRIVTDSFVKLTRGRDVLTGYGLECDPNLTAVDIKRDVEASIIDQVEDLEE